jgi:flavin-dependent dehydrogenase
MDHSHILTPYGHGYHVDRIAFDRMLAEQAAAAGAQLLTGTRLVRCHQPDNAMWTLTLESSETQTIEVEARIVIDAAGRHSLFSRWRGARRMVFDQLVSVACGFMDRTASDQCYTLVETCEDGWWYSAPAGQNRLVGMLMTDGDLPAAAEAKDREGWMRALRRTNATRERMQSAKICWGPRVFSAISQRIIRSEFGSNWLSVGDAALAVDPISGSGVIRALRMARAAAETAIAILDCDPKAIARYEFARHDECTDYLHERIAYYQLEHRWEQSPF